MDERERSREALLRAVWREILATTPDNVQNFPAAQRAIAAGASTEDVVTAMQAACYETAFRLLYLFTSQHAPDPEDAMDFGIGWALVDFDLTKTSPPSAFEGTYEDLMEADPSGRATEDFWN